MPRQPLANPPHPTLARQCRCCYCRSTGQFPDTRSVTRQAVSGCRPAHCVRPIQRAGAGIQGGIGSERLGCRQRQGQEPEQRYSLSTINHCKTPWENEQGQVVAGWEDKVLQRGETGPCRASRNKQTPRRVQRPGCRAGAAVGLSTAGPAPSWCRPAAPGPWRRIPR